MKNSIIAAGLYIALLIPAHAHEGRSRVDAVVAKVDEAAGKITLKHDEIPNLQMQAMTMAWTVKDPAMLKGLKAGDKVRFEAEEINGTASVVEIEKVK